MLRKYPELYNSRVTYRIFYATTYLVTTEGTQIRVGRSFAAIEASLGAETDDGTPVHNFVTRYAESSGRSAVRGCACAQQLDRARPELVALRSAPPVQDYDGPVLFEAPAAGSLLAQLLGPSVGGQRPPLSTNTRFDQTMESLGGRSDWMNRSGQRVLPAAVSLVDDPTVKDFQGQKLIGSYGVDQEGVQRAKSGAGGKRHAASIADVAAARAGVHGIQRTRPLDVPGGAAADDEQPFLHGQRRPVAGRPAQEISRRLQAKRTEVVPADPEDG